MWKNRLWIAALAILTLVTAAEIEAQHGGGRGGGGGRGKGGGGGHRGGGANRTPSMTRSGGKQHQNIRKNQGGQGQRKFDRQGSLNSTRQHVQQRGNRNFNKGNLTPKQQSIKSNFRNNQKNNFRNVSQKRNNWNKYRPESRNWFRNDFFVNRNYRPYYWNNNVNWWRPYGWAGISGWMGYTNNYPVYYYDDDNDPVELDQNDIYIYDAAQQPPSEESNVYIPVISGVTTPAPAGDVQGDWLPLGVFAVGRNDSDVDQSTMIIQLALNKNGEIGGTYFNTATNITRELVGEVDRTTQEAVWRFSDNPNAPVASTGLYNLSLPQTTVKVDFPDGSQQTWLLLRLQE